MAAIVVPTNPITSSMPSFPGSSAGFHTNARFWTVSTGSIKCISLSRRSVPLCSGVRVVRGRLSYVCRDSQRNSAGSAARFAQRRRFGSRGAPHRVAGTPLVGHPAVTALYRITTARPRDDPVETADLSQHRRVGPQRARVFSTSQPVLHVARVVPPTDHQVGGPGAVALGWLSHSRLRRLLCWRFRRHDFHQERPGAVWLGTQAAS